MFKSVFAKLVTAFMLIIIISFGVIITLISIIIGNYSDGEKERLTKWTGDRIAIFLENKIEIYENKDHSFSAVSPEDNKDVSSFLSGIVQGDETVMVILSDVTGTALSVYQSHADSTFYGTSLTEESIALATNEGVFLDSDEIPDDAFQSRQIVYARNVCDSNGNIIGVVWVCTPIHGLTALAENISRAIVRSMIWILLAAMIAVYFIIERMMSPLRQISIAAKSFAAGNFDVRVTVKGNDEIAELAVAVNNMAESMNNYDAMRNNFMSNVSHDLRTPMTSISGFIDGILDGVIPPDKHQYYLQLVSSEIKRLSRLVASLLDLSRIQAGERKFSMSTFDICEMGRQILISFEQKINDKKLDVEFECDDENMRVIADRDAIHQILYNLCDNAVKFASDSGKLRISVQKLKNRRVLVSVYNEGQGIAKVDIPYVFERFYKSDKSRGLNRTGVGLGLFIAKTIVDAHGEKIWVESEEGKNCKFSFTLSGE